MARVNVAALAVTHSFPLADAVFDLNRQSLTSADGTLPQASASGSFVAAGLGPLHRTASLLFATPTRTQPSTQARLRRWGGGVAVFLYL